jgi:hypothetical protein
VLGTLLLSHTYAQEGGLECFERAWVGALTEVDRPYNIAWIDHRAIVDNFDVPLLVNFSDLANPVVIAELPALDGNLGDMVYADGLLYAAFRVSPGGVRIFDMADPANPVELGVYEPSNGYELLRRVGDFILTAEYPNDTLEILNVSDPTSPRRVRTILQAGRARSMDSTETLLVVVESDPNAVRLYDLADPSNPVEVAAITTDVSFLWEARLVGDVLWYTNSSFLQAWDVSDPSDPVLVLRSDIASGIQFDVLGDRLVVEDNGIVCLDVSDPANPFVIQHQVPQGRTIREIAMVPASLADQPTAAILDTAGVGLLAIDPAADPLVASLGAFDNSDADFAGDLLAHVGIQSLHITDASDPLAPVELGQLLFGERTNLVRTNGQIALVNEQGVGLSLVDLADPTRLEVMSILQPTFEPTDAAFFGERPLVALAMGPAGVALLDFADPANPRLTGRFGVSTNAQAVAVDDDMVFVADAEQGLYVLDASDPDQPTVAAHLPAMQGAVAMAIDGDRLYFAESALGLWTFDISSPTSPQLIGYQSMGFSMTEMAGRQENRILIGGSSVHYFDATDPSDLKRIGAWPVNPPGFVGGVRLTAESAVVAGRGVSILALGDCPVACRADLDADGELTIFDFLAFGTLFDAGDLRADFDADGALTVLDYLVFLNEFDAGCP